MNLFVLSAGPLLSVQDRGRRGFRSNGVSAAGPMDAPALAFANALCSNDSDAAALEFAGLGGQFKAEAPICFAVTGGECDIRIDNKPVAAGETHRLEAGAILKIGALKEATWGYLAIGGGIQTPLVIGSRSTHLRFGLGGLDGRALVAGDMLPLLDTPPTGPLLRPATARAGANLPQPRGPIRIIAGPQDAYFDADVLARLTAEPFTITRQRDRMASVLDGPALPAARGHDIVSDGTVPGVIQVPGSGQPIVLMAECQTTGGYPKIATIISADLARFAQMPTGAQFTFQIVDRRTGEDAARQIHTTHQAKLSGLVQKAGAILSSSYLLSCDLVGGIFDPASVMGTDLVDDNFVKLDLLKDVMP